MQGCGEGYRARARARGEVSFEGRANEKRTKNEPGLRRVRGARSRLRLVRETNEKRHEKRTRAAAGATGPGRRRGGEVPLEECARNKRKTKRKTNQGFGEAYIWLVEANLAPIWRGQSGNMAKGVNLIQSGEAQSGEQIPIW